MKEGVWPKGRGGFLQKPLLEKTTKNNAEKTAAGKMKKTRRRRGGPRRKQPWKGADSPRGRKVLKRNSRKPGTKKAP